MRDSDEQAFVEFASGAARSLRRTAYLITGLDDGSAEDAYVLQAGTRDRDGGVETAGGRVLSVVGLGPDLARARAAAYERVAGLSFDGMHARRDIAEAAAASSPPQ